MEKKSPSWKRQSPQFQIDQIQRQKQSQYITPSKKQSNRIFVETPQALFIPLSMKNNELIEYEKSEESPEKQKKTQKLNIFDQNKTVLKREKSQISQISLFTKDRNQEQQTSSIIKSKVEIFLKKERVSEFFYYQNFIVCKALRKVIIYNSLDKSLTEVPIKSDEFILTPFPPYVFNCITGQYLNLYNEEAIDKYGEVQRRKQIALKRQKQFQYQQNSRSGVQEGNKRWQIEKESEVLSSGIKVVIIKISKLEVECICRFGQAYYMGGYNRSLLPGGKRSERREVYLMESLDPKINNKPKEVIKIDSSNHPVSQIHVQMPYLVVYCRPTFYVFGFKSHELLLRFQKELKLSLLLQGRYALNVMNGIGISSRNTKPTIFTYDMENFPIYGVEITEHKQEATCLCLQKTGRIFGCLKSALFEYIPNKRITKCVKLYSESETILSIECTPSNNLLVLRQSDKLEYFIEAFSIDEGSINDY